MEILIIFVLTGVTVVTRAGRRLSSYAITDTFTIFDGISSDSPIPLDLRSPMHWYVPLSLSSTPIISKMQSCGAVPSWAAPRNKASQATADCKSLIYNKLEQRGRACWGGKDNQITTHTTKGQWEVLHLLVVYSSCPQWTLLIFTIVCGEIICTWTKVQL